METCTEMETENSAVDSTDKVEDRTETNKTVVDEMTDSVPVKEPCSKTEGSGPPVVLTEMEAQQSAVAACVPKVVVGDTVPNLTAFKDTSSGEVNETPLPSKESEANLSLQMECDEIETENITFQGSVDNDESNLGDDNELEKSVFENQVGNAQCYKKVESTDKIDKPNVGIFKVLKESCERQSDESGFKVSSSKGSEETNMQVEHKKLQEEKYKTYINFDSSLSKTHKELLECIESASNNVGSIKERAKNSEMKQKHINVVPGTQRLLEAPILLQKPFFLMMIPKRITKGILQDHMKLAASKVKYMPGNRTPVWIVSSPAPLTQHTLEAGKKEDVIITPMDFDDVKTDSESVKPSYNNPHRQAPIDLKSVKALQDAFFIGPNAVFGKKTGIIIYTDSIKQVYVDEIVRNSCDKLHIKEVVMKSRRIQIPVIAVLASLPVKSMGCKKISKVQTQDSLAAMKDIQVIPSEKPTTSLQPVKGLEPKRNSKVHTYKSIARKKDIQIIPTEKPTTGSYQEIIVPLFAKPCQSATSSEDRLSAAGANYQNVKFSIPLVPEFYDRESNKLIIPVQVEQVEDGKRSIKPKQNLVTEKTVKNHDEQVPNNTLSAIEHNYASATSENTKMRPEQYVCTKTVADPICITANVQSRFVEDETVGSKKQITTEFQQSTPDTAITSGTNNSVVQTSSYMDTVQNKYNFESSLTHPICTILDVRGNVDIETGTASESTTDVSGSSVKSKDLCNISGQNNFVTSVGEVSNVKDKKQVSAEVKTVRKDITAPVNTKSLSHKVPSDVTVGSGVKKVGDIALCETDIKAAREDKSITIKKQSPMLPKNAARVTFHSNSVLNNNSGSEAAFSTTTSPKTDTISPVHTAITDSTDPVCSAMNVQCSSEGETRTTKNLVSDSVPKGSGTISFVNDSTGKPTPISDSVSKGIRTCEKGPSSKQKNTGDHNYQVPKVCHCYCCGRSIILCNIYSSTLRKEGFPDILFKYAGVKRIKRKEGYICLVCKSQVVEIHRRMRIFMNKYQNYAAKIGRNVSSASEDAEMSIDHDSTASEDAKASVSDTQTQTDPKITGCYCSSRAGPNIITAPMQKQMTIPLKMQNESSYTLKPVFQIEIDSNNEVSDLIQKLSNNFIKVLKKDKTTGILSTEIIAEPEAAVTNAFVKYCPKNTEKKKELETKSQGSGMVAASGKDINYSAVIRKNEFLQSLKRHETDKAVETPTETNAIQCENDTLKTAKDGTNDVHVPIGFQNEINVGNCENKMLETTEQNENDLSACSKARIETNVESGENNMIKTSEENESELSSRTEIETNAEPSKTELLEKSKSDKDKGNGTQTETNANQGEIVMLKTSDQSENEVGRKISSETNAEPKQSDTLNVIDSGGPNNDKDHGNLLKAVGVKNRTNSDNKDSKRSTDHSYTSEPRSDSSTPGSELYNMKLDSIKKMLYSVRYNTSSAGSLPAIVFNCCGNQIPAEDICNQLIQTDYMREQFESKLVSEVRMAACRLNQKNKSECTELMNKSFDDVVNISWLDICHELWVKFPVLAKLLTALTDLPTKKLENAIQPLAMAYGILMFTREKRFGRVQHFVSNVLLEHLSPERLFISLSRLGLCMGYNTTLKLLRSPNCPFNVEKIQEARKRLVDPRRKNYLVQKTKKETSVNENDTGDGESSSGPATANKTQLTSKLKAGKRPASTKEHGNESNSKQLKLQNGKAVSVSSRASSLLKHFGQQVLADQKKMLASKYKPFMKLVKSPRKRPKKLTHNESDQTSEPTKKRVCLVQTGEKQLKVAQVTEADLNVLVSKQKLDKQPGETVQVVHELLSSEHVMSSSGENVITVDKNSYDTFLDKLSPVKSTMSSVRKRKNKKPSSSQTENVVHKSVSPLKTTTLDTLCRKVHLLTPADLEKYHISYSADFISQSPFGMLKQMDSFSIPDEQCDLYDEFMFDIYESDVRENGTADAVIASLIQTARNYEERVNAFPEQFPASKQALEWLQAVSKMVIRFKLGLSIGREETDLLMRAFIAYCGLNNHTVRPRQMRVLDSKLMSEPTACYTAVSSAGRNKSLIIAEVHNRQCFGPVTDTEEGTLFEKLAGELLLEAPHTFFFPYVFGMVFHKTSVMVARLHISRQHLRKLQTNCPLDPKHKGTIVYSKFHDLLRSRDRLEVMRFLWRLSEGSKSSNVDTLDPEAQLAARQIFVETH